MYDITDIKEITKEIKKYLYKISTTTYPEIKRGTVDGIYDTETEESVKRFQEIKGLPKTGVVDYRTFIAISDEYDDIMLYESLPDSIVEYQSFPMLYGDTSEDVRLLNMMINELSKTYRELNEVGTGSFYSKRTKAAIERLEEIFGLDKTGITDARLFHRIKEEMKSIKRNRKTDDLKQAGWQ